MLFAQVPLDPPGAFPWATIISIIVTGLLAALPAILAYMKGRVVEKKLDDNTAKTVQVHEVVNGQRLVLENTITELKTELAGIKKG